MQVAAFIKRAFSNDVDASIRITDPVIEGVESIDAWIAHRDKVVQELCPVGALEIAHAKRAAVYLWRLDRVIRFEVAAKNDDSNDQTAENRDDQAGSARSFTPDRSTIETIIKYESHLDRRLAATMTELRKLQKERRQGLRSIDSDLTPLDSDLDAERSTQTMQSQSVASDESIPPRVIERSSSAIGEPADSQTVAPTDSMIRPHELTPTAVEKREEKVETVVSPKIEPKKGVGPAQKAKSRRDSPIPTSISGRSVHRKPTPIQTWLDRSNRAGSSFSTNLDRFSEITSGGLIGSDRTSSELNFAMIPQSAAR